MSLVRLSGLTKRFGATVAVHPLDFSIDAGDFVAILGPSGCGKTTLLRMIGGFEEASGGRIEIAGRDVTTLKPEHRPTNMVFQSYGLFPHMTVRQNIAYGPRLRKSPPAKVASDVDDMLRLVHLEAFAERPIQKLSGGEQQRVALARALIMRPAVLLLDEPLAALDLKLRKAMQDELRRLHQAVRGTFVFVTHDQGEALGLANRIAVMEAGKIVQVGGPQDIYLRPATRFVSTFIGDANVFSACRRQGTVRLPWGETLASAGPDGPVSLMIRPESIRLTTPERHSGEVLDVVFLGPVVKVSLKLADGSGLAMHLPQSAADEVPGRGQRAGFALESGSIRLFEGNAEQ